MMTTLIVGAGSTAAGAIVSGGGEGIKAVANKAIGKNCSSAIFKHKVEQSVRNDFKSRKIKISKKASTGL